MPLRYYIKGLKNSTDKMLQNYEHLSRLNGEE